MPAQKDKTLPFPSNAKGMIQLIDDGHPRQRDDLFKAAIKEGGLTPVQKDALRGALCAAARKQRFLNAFTSPADQRRAEDFLG